MPNVDKKSSIWHLRGVSATYISVPNVGKKLAIWHRREFLPYNKFASGSEDVMANWYSLRRQVIPKFGFALGLFVSLEREKNHHI